ncbi:MAG: hypothetical protein O7A65_10465 [Proteobacteria bacterium]|nr:hypothetical protein [Pseudomonadota bacterium]
MCGLCGALANVRHWSDAAGRPGFGGVDRLRSRREERLGRVRALNHLLRFYGFYLKDWRGSSYVLCDRRGQLEIIDNLPELWRKLEKHAGRPLNPLDPELIATLDGNA